MAWWDDMAADVRTAAERAANEIASAADVEGWIRALVDAIRDDQPDTIDTLLDRLRSFFPFRELANLILSEATRRRDPETLAKAVLFVFARLDQTNEYILEVLWARAQDREIQKLVLEILASSASNLDNLLAAISRQAAIAQREMLELLVQIDFEGGRDRLWQLLLQYASRSGLEDLFKTLVEVLHSAAGGQSSKLVGLCLGIETTSLRLRALAALLAALAERGWLDLRVLVRFVFEQFPVRLKDVVAALLACGVLHWNRIATLLELPTELYRADSIRQEKLFSALLDSLRQAAERLGAVQELADALAAWLIDVCDHARITTGRLPNVAVARPAVEVPVLLRLLGQALGAIAGGTPAIPGAASALARALVNALRARGSAGDAVLALIMRVPAAFVVLLPFLVLAAAAIPMQFPSWFGQDVRHLRQSDRTLDILELPAPGSEVGPAGHRRRAKYMVFSDIHRDAPGDVLDHRFFDCGNFAKNADLYLRALRYCDANGYTVIENGDCEELWFKPHLFDDPQARSSDILHFHADIFAMLKVLHDKGQYFRTRGNHDNWWVLDPAHQAELKQLFGPGFKIFDALVIPDVLTMETDYVELLQAYSNASTDDDRWRALIDAIPVGLSPDRYREKLPLFILHGHQVDFWNCDEHHFLGLIITNAVGVPADGVDALPYFLKGLDLAGNPVHKFTDMLAPHAPWGNWPPEDVARRWARQIEFMPETERRLLDDCSFSETLAASLSLVLGYQNSGPLGVCGKPGPQVQILTGHTHNIQSRPYLNLPDWPLGPLPDKAEQAIKLCKAPYFNSGTCGWWEGVLWGIEITYIGQPRASYWDRQCQAPHLMSWELHDAPIVVPGDIRALLTQLQSLAPAGGTAVPAPLQGLLASITPFAAPALAGARQAAMGTLSTVEQYAACAMATLLGVRAALCGGSLPHCDLTLDIDLNKLPRLEAKHGELPALSQVPTTGLGRFISRWVDHLGLLPEPTPAIYPAEHLRQLAGVLFHAAFAYRSGLLGNLGHLLNLCTGGHLGVQVGLDRQQGRLSMRLLN